MHPPDAYPDLVPFNRQRTLVDVLGRELVESIVDEYLEVLGTAMTVFEANGDYVTFGRPRGWCRVMDELSLPDGAATPETVASGRWSCRASCRAPALEAMRRGGAVEADCPGGLRVHAVPIRAGGEIVGAISVGCGNPPTDEARLGALATRLGVKVERIQGEAARVPRAPLEVEALASQAIRATARLLGELVERHRTAADRERSSELFVSMIAHDLRVPLSTIVLASKLLESGVPAERDARLAERVERSARKMIRMVEDLLDFTRARLGSGIQLRIQPHRLDDILREVVDELGLSHPHQEIRRRGTDGGDTTLECDANRLNQVIENLLENAIKYGNGSPIDAEIATSADEVVLRVHNLGAPIPADLLPRIFDAFAQGSRPPAAVRSAGLGLGLHVAREIVRAHGGTIGVESGEAGTTFVVHVPRRQSQRPSPPASSCERT